jgi:hypothetical protein
MKSKCIIVLGMHRSGTSALAGTLGLLGVEIGSTLIPAHPDINAKGFWENADIVAIHDRMLEELGSSWHDERELPHEWWTLPRLKPFCEELKEIVKRDYESSALWLIKDPRLCRLLPFWASILESVVDEVKVILIVRHPREVAKSLKRRDGISLERAYMLWIQYMISAEKSSREYPRMLISYEQLLSDWRAVVDSASRKLDLPFTYKDTLIERKIDAFLDNSLRHHVATSDLEEYRPLNLAESVYKLCLDEDDLSCLNEVIGPVEDEVSEIAEQLRPWSDEVQALYRTCENQAELLAKQKHISMELEHISMELERELLRVKSTISWQITKPLRAIWSVGNNVMNMFLQPKRK